MTSSSYNITSTIKQSPPIDVSQPYDASTLRNKTILVTGAANGLGAHMVRRWASHGAHITIGDIDDQAGESLVSELALLHPDSVFTYAHCDVTSWEQQGRLFEQAVRASPTSSIDIVVPNAGIIQTLESFQFENPRPLPGGKLAKPSTRTVDINITGVIYTTHLALYYFSKPPKPQNRNGNGNENGSEDESEGESKRPTHAPAPAPAPAPTSDKCLLLIGSIASIYPLAGQTHYTMSKHAICGLFRSLRMTAFMQSSSNLRVNMLAPYFVEQSRMLSTVADIAFLGGTAGGATIPDVVDAATRLVADESIAGRALAVGPALKSAPEGGWQGVQAVAKHEGGGRGRAAWEIYAHDYDEVDAFTYRYIRLMNSVTQLRGLLGWFLDFWVKLLRR
ncbi:hypothetical protein QQS21_005288 [Conoideocrella luteorostrata]|uniref:Uncharacterized protein n=1 Tax=Conoideocrella luteorostrata TaxID=1105319 RepID=A0AAJ0FZ57_9HYPO|nr:hypothetical protein QQS21_005288 [Conoideocrella luteorostrata]